ncbi:oxygenase MpaB family protein [Salinibacterium sp. ZJ450]|uniref:oxygenase MpaB family protein n=1 Tax=Salinibacterium sp. ZJ450 TaxID=2708338 RepID=UPI00142293C3|nr:oxygenase MpaB family protein [Salinibacterium sp. ZJ450]
MGDPAGSSIGATRWRPGRHGRREPPAWTRSLVEGEDEGFFGPGSAVWTVNGALPTLVAGIRALLLQTLHPGAMAGVHDHSSYNDDPLGRLDGTVRWVATTTFGDRRSAIAASAFVSRLHERVTGTYVDARGVERSYAANSEELLRWVHDAFTEAFIGAHQIWGGPIPGGADAYVREWAQAGRLMGVQHPPTSIAELRDEMTAFLDDAKPDERVAEAVRFLRRPGLPGLTGKAYPILFGGAVASLDPRYRELLGLRRPWWPAVTMTRLLLIVGKRVLGPVSPSEQNARARLAMLAARRSAEVDPHR